PGSFDNYQANSLFRNRQTKADGRLDNRFSDKLSAFLRYGYTNDWAGQNSPYGPVIGSNVKGRLVAQNAVADVTYVLSHSLISDFRFGYNRFQQSLGSIGELSTLGTGFGGGLSLPSINISGFAPIGTSPNLPEHAVDNTFNWVWAWAWNHGIHNIT